ncbi:MAG: hypothetical protein PHR35_09090 [Kiritimatiellae bacterium]|nr:hypothetical protein [Kiritimatiellia bacterium]
MTIRGCNGLLLVALSLVGLARGQLPVVEFRGNGSLAFTDGGGKTNAVEFYGAASKFLPRDDKQGIYLTIPRAAGPSS